MKTRRGGNFVVSFLSAVYVCWWAAVFNQGHFEERLIQQSDLTASWRGWFSAPSSGIVSIFGVPVYDVGVDLGARLPDTQGFNFSGFVLLRSVMPQFWIVLLGLGLSVLLVAWAILRLFGDLKLKFRYGLLAILLLQSSILWTISKFDWITSAISIVAGSSLLCVLLRLEVSRLGSKQTSSMSSIDIVAIISFSVSASMSHFGLLVLFFPTGVLYVVFRFKICRRAFLDHSVAILMALLPFMFAFVTFLLQREHYEAYLSSRRSTITSFPALSLSGARQIFGQILVGELPVLDAVRHFGMHRRFRVQYYALQQIGPMVIATFAAVALRAGRSRQTHRILVVLFLFYGCLLVQSMSFLFAFQEPFRLLGIFPSSQDLWPTLAAAGGSLIAPLCVGITENGMLTRQKRAHLWLAIAVLVLGSLGLAHHLHLWSYQRAEELSLVRYEWSELFELRTLVGAEGLAGERVLDLSNTAVPSEQLRAAGLVPVAQPSKLQSGQSLIMKSQLLTDGDSHQLRAKCPNKEVDFLAAKVTLLSASLYDLCSTTSQANLTLLDGESRTMVTHEFHFWWAESKPYQSCQLLDDGCMQRLGLVPSKNKYENPIFKLTTGDAQGEIAQIRFPDDIESSYLVIPLAFDSAISITGRNSNNVVAIENFGGLVAVDRRTLSSLNEGSLVVSVKTDIDQAAAAILPWLWTLAFLVTMLLLRRSDKIASQTKNHSTPEGEAVASRSVGADFA